MVSVFSLINSYATLEGGKLYLRRTEDTKKEDLILPFPPFKYGRHNTIIAVGLRGRRLFLIN